MPARLIVLVALLGIGIVAGWWWTEPASRVERMVTAVPPPSDGVVVEDVFRSEEGCFLRPCPQRLVVYATSATPERACADYDAISSDWSDRSELDLGRGAAVCAWVGEREGVLLGAVVETVADQTEVVISGRPVR